MTILWLGSPGAFRCEQKKVAGGKASGPREVKGGWQFSFRAPSAKTVYIAGDFNNWAEHKEGIISNPKYLMKKGGDGIWRKTVRLTPGKHIYKFNVDNNLPWMPDPNNSEPRDPDDNSILIVKQTKGADGSGPKKVKGGWQFSFRAPSAKKVYLAGDFNNWADNDNGMVSDSAHLMKKGADGIWRKTVRLASGKHSYKFVVDGTQWSPDPNNTAPRDQDDNSVLMAK